MPFSWIIEWYARLCNDKKHQSIKTASINHGTVGTVRPNFFLTLLEYRY